MEKVDLDIREKTDLFYTDELRKRIDTYFNKRLKKPNNFNSYYSEREGTLFLNFNIFKVQSIDKIDVTLKIEKND